VQNTNRRLFQRYSAQELVILARCIRLYRPHIHTNNTRRVLVGGAAADSDSSRDKCRAFGISTYISFHSSHKEHYCCNKNSCGEDTPLFFDNNKYY
jgi:hypothetical protein